MGQFLVKAVKIRKYFETDFNLFHRKLCNMKRESFMNNRILQILVVLLKSCLLVGLLPKLNRGSEVIRLFMIKSKVYAPLGCKGYNRKCFSTTLGAQRRPLMGGNWKLNPQTFKDAIKLVSEVISLSKDRALVDRAHISFSS